MKIDRETARRAGYFVREGEYRNTQDNRLGRYYVGRAGEMFCPYGAGHRTQKEAWRAACEQAAAGKQRAE